MSRSFGLVLMSLVVLVPLTAQGAQRAQEERLELVHADQLVGERRDGITVRKLEGHVFFRQGATEMRCERAVQFAEQNRVIFEGNVDFRRPSQTLRADRIIYDASTREEWAEGNVVVRDTLRELRCRVLHYQEVPEVGRASGGVVLRHFETRAVLWADTVMYYRTQGIAEGWGRAKIVQEDSLGKPVFTLTGSRLRWENDSELFVAHGDVRIEQQGSWATCDTLRYYRGRGVAVLKGSPETWRRWERMVGREMEWRFAGDSLREVRVRREAMVVSEADTLHPGLRRNQVRGDSIRIYFAAGEPKKVEVKGRATSLYYLFEDAEPKGANWVLGDEILLWVRSGQIQRVEIQGDPEPAEGKYFPERIVHMAPKDIGRMEKPFPGQR